MRVGPLFRKMRWRCLLKMAKTAIKPRKISKNRNTPAYRQIQKPRGSRPIFRVWGIWRKVINSGKIIRICRRTSNTKQTRRNTKISRPLLPTRVENLLGKNPVKAAHARSRKAVLESDKIKPTFNLGHRARIRSISSR